MVAAHYHVDAKYLSGLKMPEVTMTEFCVVSVTWPETVDVAAIAGKLVAERLCACASISKGHRSFYTWKGDLEASDEILMTIKTRADLLENLEERIRELHPYEVFEFLAVPVIYGNKAYLDWITESVCR